MSKRFTETNKWNDQWFRKLTPTLKLGWAYLTDNCDAAGVIELDRELADFQIGAAVDWEALTSSSEGRIEHLQNGRLWLTKFVAFQYGTLSDACPPHRPAIRALEKHGLTGKVTDRYAIPNGNPQEQEQDKDKDKGGAGGKSKRVKFTPPEAADVEAYCVERKNGISGQKFVDHYQARGWKVKGGGNMIDWKAAVRTWEGNEFNRGSPAETKAPEYRRVSLTVFNAHAAAKDFLVGPHKEPGDGHQRVFGQLKSKRKIESHTDPNWTP